MSVKLLTEHHLEFLSSEGGCTDSSESIHVKCHIVGNHVTAQMFSYAAANTRHALSHLKFFLCLGLTVFMYISGNKDTLKV